MRCATQLRSITAAKLALVSIAVLLLLALPFGGGASDAARDPVKLTFAFIGCNRIGFSAWNPQTNPSSANVAQLQQNFQDITNLRPIPSHLFFGGDLVLNEAADQGQTLQGQLDGWQQLYATDPSGIAGKTTLVPMPGNHELLQSVEVPGGFGFVEFLNPATTPVWLNWFTSNGYAALAGNGPTNAPPNPDLLADDESPLTYSFDVGDTHFVVLNTDSLTTTGNISWIAINWATDDINRAERNSRVRHIFVLGHKPMVVPLESSSVDNSIIQPLGSRLRAVLNHSRKARAYICAHAHQWEATQLGGRRAVWQVVAGNGGSQLTPPWQPPGGPYFGFTVFKVYRSGRVGLVSYTRPVPPVYYEPPTQPAQPRKEIFLDRNGLR